jgi:hypothetical protein
VPVATSALITERAAQQVDRLHKKERRSYDQFLLALRAHGCASLNYRLSGDDLLSRICVAHLSGALRVVVAFSAHDVATILLVGPHDDQDPFIDVYSQLYELAGLAEPPAARRTKPPCCEAENGEPPVPDGELLADLVDRARQLSGAAKRRARGSTR